MGSADLADPAIIREFIGRLARFQQQAEATLATAGPLLSRTHDHLRLELQPRWKKELGRRQEAYSEARRRWLDAEYDVKASGRRGSIEKSSSIDERREMLKAQRRVEEAEEKLRAIATWLGKLDSDGKELASRCRDHEFGLHEMCARARVDLDQRCRSIEEYLERQRGSRT